MKPPLEPVEGIQLHPLRVVLGRASTWIAIPMVFGILFLALGLPA